MLTSRLIIAALVSVIIALAFAQESTQIPTTSAPSSAEPSMAPSTSVPTTATPTPTITTTQTPTATNPHCWTCPPLYVHWFDTNMAAPDNGDQCQCVLATSIDEHGCKHCPQDWKHWYELDLEGPIHGDNCLCIDTSIPTTKAPETTAKPTTTRVVASTIKPTTTGAPTVLPTNQSGDNLARSDAKSLVVSSGLVTILAVATLL